MENAPEVNVASCCTARRVKGPKRDVLALHNNPNVEQGKGGDYNSKPRERSPTRGLSEGPPERGTSPSGKHNATPCKWYYKGQCQKGKACECWHPPPCVHYKRGKCTNDKCAFLHGAAPKQNLPPALAAVGNPQQDPKAKANAKAKDQDNAAHKSALAKVIGNDVSGRVAHKCVSPQKSNTPRLPFHIP